MSLSSISSQLPRTVEQTQRMENNLRASTDCGPTVTKVIAVFASVLISAAAFAIGGTLVGLVTVVICGIGLAKLFQISCPQNLGTRYMNGYPPPGHDHGPGRGGHDPYAPGHVGVGAGHMHGPGRGYVPPGGHVPVGRGHGLGAPGGHPPHGHPPLHGHVAVGRGHDHGPTGAGAPPPSGPGGHVPVGRR